MLKLPRPVRNLLTGGVLLTPSGIFTFVGCLQPEMSWVERLATIWEMLQYESRPESPLSPLSARPKHHDSHGIGSCVETYPRPRSLTPRVAEFFAEELIVIESLPRFTGARCARPALVESISDRSEAQDYLAKAQESLHGTASELAHQHFNRGGRLVEHRSLWWRRTCDPQVP
jgi:hypothetical protein